MVIMNRFVSILLTLIVALCMVSCKRSTRNTVRAVRSAIQVERINDTEDNVTSNSQVDSKLKLDVPIFGEPIQQEDSLAYKCFAVDVILPADTTNYVRSVQTLLPYATRLNEYTYLSVNVKCYLKTDSCHFVSSHNFLYRKGEPMIGVSLHLSK